MLTVNCSTNSNKFLVEIRHFAGAAGLTIYYLISENKVQVDTDCDFQDCKRKTLYVRDLNAEQSGSLFQALKALHLDTLKNNYRPKGMVFDGLVTAIKIRGDGLPSKEISIDNVELPATDSLYKLIDRLILTKKYQFYHFGEE